MRAVHAAYSQTDDCYLSTSAARTRMLEALEAVLARNLPVKPAG